MENPRQKTVQEKAAEAILGGSSITVDIGGKQYQLGKPSVATIIMAAKYVSQLPELDVKSGASKIVLSVMQNAEQMAVIGKVLSVLILGAERVLQQKRVAIYPDKKKGFKQRLIAFFGKKQEQSMLEVDYLAEQILLHLSPVEIASYVSGRLIAQDINGFFVLTTSLKRQGDILEPTKSSEVDRQTTASGQQ